MRAVGAGPTASRRVVLASVLLGLLSTNINFTVFNVALVPIAHSLRTTQGTLTWAVTGPLLVVGVAAPTLGRIGDLYGHRRLYLSGLWGALVCAALTAGAWDAGSLLGARLFSGLEGACTTASSWSLLFRAYGPAERPRVLGWWSLVGAGGPVIGVAAGAPVIQAFGWRWVFLAQVPLILVAIAVNKAVLQETVRPGESNSGREPIDFAGAAALALGVAALLLAINNGADGWSRPAVVVPAATAGAALVGFSLLERRARAPLFPIEWLSRRNFVMPCLAGLALNFAYMGGFFLTPLFLERGLGYGVGEAGILQIARPLVFAVSAPLGGYLAGRFGKRPIALGGTGVLVASMWVFSSLTPRSAVVMAIGALALSGLAAGMAVPALSASVASAVELSRMGTGSAGYQVVNQVGVVAGIQAMETVQAARQHAAGVVGSFQESYLAGAAVAVMAVAAALLLRPERQAAPASAPESAPERQQAPRVAQAEA
jgi:MFS family permease